MGLKMKSFKLLISFVWFCITHRGQRFWQALRNWSNWSYIYASNGDPMNFDDAELYDTFYWNNKDGNSNLEFNDKLKYGRQNGKK